MTAPTKTFKMRVVASLALSVACAVPTQAGENWRATADGSGRWGVVQDSDGRVVLSHQFDSTNVIEPGRFIRACSWIAAQGSGSNELLCGVFGPDGQVVLSMQYRSVQYLRLHKRFMVAVGPIDHPHWGFLDEQGKTVLSPVYERADRISNMGDEPTFVVSRNSKYGYVDVREGIELISPMYDGLEFRSTDTDARGRGLGRAYQDGRVGVVTSEGKVVVPFDYAVISGAGGLEGEAIAERPDGSLVTLTLRQGRLEHVRVVPADEGLNWEPSGAASDKAMPFDGVYVSEAYPTFTAAWRGHRQGELREPRIPRIVVRGDEAFVGFGVFRQAPLMSNTLPLARHSDGFTLEADPLGTGDRVPTRLPFVQRTERESERIVDVLTCDACERMGIPRVWRKLAPPAPFGGIGIVMRTGSDGRPALMRVLNGGPADAAGLAVDDVIREINGVATDKMTPEQARDALRGPAGTTVELSVHRAGKAHTRVIRRQVIKVD